MGAHCNLNCYATLSARDCSPKPSLPTTNVAGKQSIFGCYAFCTFRFFFSFIYVRESHSIITNLPSSLEIYHVLIGALLTWSRMTIFFWYFVLF